MISIFALALAAAILTDGCSRRKKKKAAGAPVLVAKAVETNVPVQVMTRHRSAM